MKRVLTALAGILLVSAAAAAAAPELGRLFFTPEQIGRASGVGRVFF